MTAPRPLFATLPSTPRALAETLPRAPGGGGPSPWTPGATAPAAVAIDTRAIEEAARAEGLERGRAEGLAETAALRARLASLVASVERASASVTNLASAQIADATVAAIAGWLDREDRARLIAPVIAGWLERGGGNHRVAARVHPSSADLVRTALNGVTLDLVEDATLGPADVILTGGALELTHRWDDRLRELREVVASAIEADR